MGKADQSSDVPKELIDLTTETQPQAQPTICLQPFGHAAEKAGSATTELKPKDEELVSRIKKGFDDAGIAYKKATAERPTIVTNDDEEEQDEEDTLDDALKSPGERARDM